MKELFIYVKNAVDIVDVIAHYIPLFPAGNYYKGLSPFKQEKTPSFTVTPNKKIFYCFSTHIGGDVIDFVSRMENCSQYQAAIILIQRYSIPIDKTILNFEKDNQVEKDNYFKIYDIFVSWTEQKLRNNDKAIAYLRHRGIDEYWQEKYRIGYCPDSIYISDFLQYIQKESILLDEVVKTNIIQKKGRKLFFSCQDRIVFPIQNVLNLYCAYGSRIFLENDIRPKYINSVSSAEFVKKNLLYGLTQAKLKIKETNVVYFVEGYIDVIMMAQAGYENTVATMGTAMSKHHIDYIKKFVNEVIIMYDGDFAGYNAVIKSMPLFWNENIDVFIVKVPSGEDPASMVQKKLIHSVIAKKQSIISFFIEEKKTVLKDNSLKNIHEGIIHIMEVIENIEDKAKQLSLIMKVSTELSINQDYLLSCFNNNKALKKDNENKSENLMIRIDEGDVTDDYKKEQKVKRYWYLFFYLTLFFYDKNNPLSIKSIFLLNNFGLPEFKVILNAYFEFQLINNNFLDFFKDYNEKLYDHCIKIMSIYNFSYTQYQIISDKIIAISWREYHKNNDKKLFKDFLKYIS
jgi:DNA primase